MNANEDVVLRVDAADPVLRLDTPPGMRGPRFIPLDEPVGRRRVRGLVVVDKPAGCTSHDVVDRVRRIVGHGRVGHAGTLDPQVTGVLPVGLGQATRVLHLLLAAGKTYDTRMRLHGDVSPEAVREALAAQLGTIRQLPPVRSRVKRVERPRTIYEIRDVDVAGREVRFLVRCEAGTYIRKLCHDLGEQLGCGAHMSGLRRTEAGGFTLADAVTLEALEQAWQPLRKRAGSGSDTTVSATVPSETPPDASGHTPSTTADLGNAPEDANSGAAPRNVADQPSPTAQLARMLHPLEAALPARLPRMWVHDGAVPRLANGSPLYLPGVLAYTSPVTPGDEVALQTLAGHLVALGRAKMDSATLAAEQRGVAADVKRVVWPLPE